MRRNPNIIRPKTPIKPQQPLLLRNLPEAIKHALIRHRPIRRTRLFLQPRLHEIERQRQETRKEARNSRRCERLCTGGEVGRFELVLGLTEERKLSEIQRHGTHDGWIRAGPESRDAFCLRDAAQGVDDGCVVCALSNGLQTVGLHADECEVSGIADDGGEAACCEAGARALFETDCVAFLLGGCGERLHKCVEEADARGGVDCLSKQTGTQASVQVHDFALCEDVFEDCDRCGFRSGFDALARELQAYFDHVDGLDDGGCGHAGEAAIDEGQGTAHKGCVEKVGSGFFGVLGGFGHGGGCVAEDGFGGLFGGFEGAGGLGHF
jgi:hypothetical protein